MLAFRQVSFTRRISSRRTSEVRPKNFSKIQFDRGPGEGMKDFTLKELSSWRSSAYSSKVGTKSISLMEKQQWIRSQKKASASSKPWSIRRRMSEENLPKTLLIWAWSAPSRRSHHCLIRSARKSWKLRATKGREPPLEKAMGTKSLESEKNKRFWSNGRERDTR